MGKLYNVQPFPQGPWAGGGGSCHPQRHSHWIFQVQLNKKTSFFNESKEQHYNLKRTEIALYMKGAFPPQRLALYAKV